MNGPTEFQRRVADDVASALSGVREILADVYVELWRGKTVLWVRSSSGCWYMVTASSLPPPETAERLASISIRGTPVPQISQRVQRILERS